MGRPSVQIWTDGGMNGRNPGPGAAAAIFTFDGRVRVMCKPLGECTNNVAETWAAIIAIKGLRRPCDVTIFTDSDTYVRRGIEKLFRNKMHKTHTELWTTLKDAIKKGHHNVEVRHTYGHSDDPINNLADAWAGHCAVTQQPVDIYYDSLADALEVAPWNGKKQKNTRRDKAYKKRRWR